MMRSSILLSSAVMVAAAALGSAQTKPQEAPFAGETLRYTINWPSGLGLGESQLISKRTGDRWRFAMSLDAAVSGFIVSDFYQSAATGEFCSEELVKTSSHGKKKAAEKMTFDQQKNTATRQTMTDDGGKSEVHTTACARDALTFLYFLRRELAQGRIPPAQTVYFGAPYVVKVEFGGTPSVKVNDHKMQTERLKATLKGPASELEFELFFARDAARTPVMVRVPFPSGAFTMELVR